MNILYFHAATDDPRAVADALTQVTGIGDVRMFEAGSMPDEAGPLDIAWLLRRGRFALDLVVYARDFGARETQARLCRAVAKTLGKPVLFSDCSPFPYSYFSAEPDGSIWVQLLTPDDDDGERMDLETDYARLIFAPDAALPERAPDDPVSWCRGDTMCEHAADGPCRAFAMPCPKMRGR